MYRPTARVLTVLELLQSRATVGSAELAARLEVDARTVRSYIAMLRDMGIPVVARPGRHGGYGLRPGFRLPPLMLTNDEAVAAALGLLFARRAGLGGAAPATEGALAKIERVLPDALRAQLRALATALIVDSPDPFVRGVDHSPIPPAATLLALATAATASRRVMMTYRDRDGTETTRPFDPYAVVYPENAEWYTVGHCHLRAAVRVFRIDRVVRVEPTETPFERPADLDPRALVRRSLAHVPAPWAVELALDATREEVEDWPAPLFATLTEEHGRTILRCTATDLDWFASLLASLPFPFQVRTPPELVDALGRVHARLGTAIAASTPTNGDAADIGFGGEAGGGGPRAEALG